MVLIYIIIADGEWLREKRNKDAAIEYFKTVGKLMYRKNGGWKEEVQLKIINI